MHDHVSSMHAMHETIVLQKKYSKTGKRRGVKYFGRLPFSHLEYSFMLQALAMSIFAWLFGFIEPGNTVNVWVDSFLIRPGFLSKALSTFDQQALSLTSILWKPCRRRNQIV